MFKRNKINNYRRGLALRRSTVASALACLVLLGTALQVSAQSFPNVPHGSGAAAVFPPGTISTYAGKQYISTGASDSSTSLCGAQTDGLGDGCTATNSYFWGPNAFAYDVSGNLYIADWQNDIIRMVSKSGIITVFAGIPGHPSGTVCASASDVYGDGCPATQATLASPEAVVVDGSGNVFITDSGDNLVRMVNTSGIISVVAGAVVSPPTACGASPNPLTDIGTTASYGATGGAALGTAMCYPNALAFDPSSGNLYISDFYNYRILMVTPDITTGAGIVSALVGGSFTPTVCMTGSDDYNDGCPPTQAWINQVQDLAVDATGNLYFTDSLDNLVREVVSPTSGTPKLKLLAGIGSGVGYGDNGYTGDGGPGTSALLNQPFGIKLDSAGNVYFSDRCNNVIREISSATGNISTIAGTYSLSNTNLCSGTGAPGVISTETGSTIGDGGPATSALFNFPTRLWVDGAGNLLIADYGNNVVRQVNVSAAPSVAFASTTVDHASAETDVTVTNNGSSSLKVTSVSVPTNFNLNGSGNTCSSSEFTLAVGATCVLGIEFEPTAGGILSGNLILTDNSATGTTQKLALSGTGVAPPPASQTITFANPGTQLDGGTYTLNATASSGLAVSYAITAGSSVAKLSGNVLTFTGTGSVTVQATQAGDSGYTAATPVSETFNVVMAAYTLPASSTLSGVSISAGGSGTATFTVTSSNYAGTVSFVTSVTTTNGTAADVTATVPSVTLKSGGTATATLTVSTTSGAANHAPVTPWKNGGALMICAVLMGVPFSLRRKKVAAVLLTALAVSLIGLMVACGGGSSSQKTVAPPPPPAARVYTITVTPTGSGTVQNPSAITVTATVQ